MKKSDKHSLTGGSHRPSAPDPRTGDAIAAQASAVDALAASMPFNAIKPGEFGTVPPVGQHETAVSAAATASTLSEAHVTAKTGGSSAEATPGALAGVRTDSSGQRLTTNHGTPVGDNQNSLKAGLRGPVLLEDFILRERSPTLTTSASRNASSTPAARPPTDGSRPIGR